MLQHRIQLPCGSAHVGQGIGIGFLHLGEAGFAGSPPAAKGTIEQALGHQRFSRHHRVPEIRVCTPGRTGLLGTAACQLKGGRRRLDAEIPHRLQSEEVQHLIGLRSCLGVPVDGPLEGKENIPAFLVVILVQLPRQHGSQPLVDTSQQRGPFGIAERWRPCSVVLFRTIQGGRCQLNEPLQASLGGVDQHRVGCGVAGAGFEIGQLFDRTDRNPPAAVLQADGGQVLLLGLVEVGVTEFCVDLAEGEAHRRQALPCIGTGLQRHVDGTRQFTAPLG